jgi:hypothetical protein
MSDMKTVLVTLQLKNLDVTSTDDVNATLQALLPAITENILVAAVGDRTCGCVVSGGVSSGSGGVTGTVTVTCSF